MKFDFVDFCKLFDSQGTITIPNLSDENDADDISVQIVAKGDAKNAEKLKQMVRKNGIKMVQQACGKYVADLKVGMVWCGVEKGKMK